MRRLDLNSFASNRFRHTRAVGAARRAAGHYIVPDRQEQALVSPPAPSGVGEACVVRLKADTTYAVPLKADTTYVESGFSRTSLIHFTVRERVRIEQQVRPIDAIDANRWNAFAFGLAEPMVMPAQMQTRPQRREQIVDRRLACVDTPRLRSRTRVVHDNEWTGRLVCHQNVDGAEALARLDLLAHVKLTPSIASSSNRS